VFAFVALRIWRPTPPSKRGRSVSDRIAWTLFALGVCLMFHMVLLAAVLEDGTPRYWTTIRDHRRLFLAFSAVAIVGPLLVFLLQVSRSNRPGSSVERPPVDDLE
jgi:hypothetical protein